MPFQKGHKLSVGNKYALGYRHTEEAKKKISEAHRGRISPMTGRHHTDDAKRRIGLALAGENNYQWIQDRTKLKKKNERNDPAYAEWRRQVKNRDGQKCRIDNQDCSGKLIAHHILGWKLHPELRYEINNGITLCHAHHPRKRAKEKLLIPEFQRLVGLA